MSFSSRLVVAQLLVPSFLLTLDSLSLAGLVHPLELVSLPVPLLSSTPAASSPTLHSLLYLSNFFAADRIGSDLVLLIADRLLLVSLSVDVNVQHHLRGVLPLPYNVPFIKGFQFAADTIVLTPSA